MAFDENMDQATSTCYCLIPHPNRAAFMIVKEGEKWVLPGFPYSKSWSEKTYAEISYQIFSRYGLRATVLRRFQRGSDFLICELEVHSQSVNFSLDARWYDYDKHLETGGLGAETNQILDRWFIDAKLAEAPEARPPWERPGWFKHASDWIKTELDSSDMNRLGEIRQVKAGAFGCVLSIPTSTGNVFFKASLGEQPSEVVLTEVLAKRWPEHIIPPIKVDPLRNWMLMQDYRTLGYKPLPKSAYADASRTFASLLLESSRSVSQWKQLGCMDYGLEQIETFSQNFSDRTGPLESGIGALEKSEIELLVNIVNEWGALCPSLAKFSIPETLGNLDFRAANIVAKKTCLCSSTGKSLSSPIRFSVC